MSQLVYFSNWIGPNIPNLSKLQGPFSEYANLKGKKLADIEKNKEIITLTEDLEESYNKLKRAISEASQRFLCTYDYEKSLLLFTDSSYSAWSLVVFQEEEENISSDVRTLRPKPMIFLSGAFTNS
eukprot:snap_masked-scaffold_16-processed-gene-1.44-mRNA-1 protein AED:1.00 eAED:1.00 QI:0/-1/0/0/-1/1/1/0/125